MQPQGLEAFPFPKAPANDRTAIAELAQHCLDKRGVGCEALEAEINERVAGLYGLKADEA